MFPNCMLIMKKRKAKGAAADAPAPPVKTRLSDPAAMALVAKKMASIDARLQTLRDRSIQVEVNSHDQDVPVPARYNFRYHY